MKKLLMISIALLFADLGEAMHPEAVKSYEALLQRTINEPSRENVLELGSTLAGIERYLGADDSVGKSLSGHIKSGLVSIPGHARFFVDELEKRRSALEPGKSRNDYDNLRSTYIDGILVHLPDPETISVLGGYLFDRRDDPPPPKPGSFNDADPIPSSTRLAYEAIMNIGLRNPPVDREIYRGMVNNSEAYALSRTQTWFNEVKSGQRAFSFIGQKVEYRFKPDGTWDTLALEDSPDAIHQRSSSPTAQSADNRDRDRAVVQGIERNPWGWMIGIVAATVAVLGVIWWWRRSRLKS